ncbi:MAG: hypothetical protein QXS81_04320 [Candidatus Micrarchaeaceae archaeon]
MTIKTKIMRTSHRRAIANFVKDKKIVQIVIEPFGSEASGFDDYSDYMWIFYEEKSKKRDKNGEKE